MSEKMTGACRYCGQTAEDEGRIFYTQEEADDYATRSCSCSGARQAEAIEARAEDACQRIDMLFGEDSEESFGVQPVDEDTVSMLKQLAAMIAEDRLSGAVLKHRSYGKAELSLDSKGAIRVKRSATSTHQL